MHSLHLLDSRKQKSLRIQEKGFSGQRVGIRARNQQWGSPTQPLAPSSAFLLQQISNHSTWLSTEESHVAGIVQLHLKKKKEYWVNTPDKTVLTSLHEEQGKQ